jgi:hypothetical protein
MKVWTVGHSTHPLDAFVALLAAHDIAQVADIRTARHISSGGRVSAHQLTAFATVERDGLITYS